MIKAAGRAIAMFFVAAASVSCALAAGPLVDLHGGAVALDVSGPATDARSLRSGASLNLNLPAGSMKVEASASVGADQNDSDLWRKHGAQVEANVSALHGTALSAVASDQFTMTYRAPSSLGDPGTATHLISNENRSTEVTASFSPVRETSVQVGARRSTDLTQDASVTGAARGAHTAVQSDTQQIFAQVDWSPANWLALDAGATERNAGIRWSARQAHSSTFSAVEPHVVLSVTPWDGAQWKASVTQAVSPYDAAAFSAYASAARTADNVNIQPDHAWEFQTSMHQSVGPVTVVADYTADRWGTATEFAQVRDGVQAPASTPLKEREKVALTMSLPLGAFGMPDTSVTSRAAWQSSTVLDPVTDELRRASGETPRTFSMRLVRDLPQRHLSLGLVGQLSDATTSYQLNEISTMPAGGTVGAFLAYKPGPFEFDMNVDGLCSSAPADSFFNGTRADPQIVRQDVERSPGPTFNVALRRAF
ncbi:MAG: hypothetical protein KGJ79_16880 [Alphaproteobacteria bacterium]|nr:hypothetical protein [Alphaproteobacteria bacterium]MDE2112817.1 hypothetical protein [Alphaproteobacteria bacterium]MDE2492631.1 hypothetical protein [Alphaproteobacteria bacterium]